MYFWHLVHAKHGAWERFPPNDKTMSYDKHLEPFYEETRIRGDGKYSKDKLGRFATAVKLKPKPSNGQSEERKIP